VEENSAAASPTVESKTAGEDVGRNLAGDNAVHPEDGGISKKNLEKYLVVDFGGDQTERHVESVLW
jgi:hypothetical protein